MTTNYTTRKRTLEARNETIRRKRERRAKYGTANNNSSKGANQ